MAMVRISPLQVDVRVGWFDGRPRSVRLADERLPVLAVERVRSERAAHPVESEPRTLYEVRTPTVTLALAFGHRTRRWTVQAVDPGPVRAAA
jgi:hypothetical protein